MMNSRWGQPCDFAILNQESTALTKTVGVSESYGHVGREFKLRPFSAGSILTLRNKTEPLASTTSQQITYRTRDVANFDDPAIWFHFLHKRLQRRRRREPPAKSMLATRRSHCL